MQKAVNKPLEVNTEKEASSWEEKNLLNKFMFDVFYDFEFRHLFRTGRDYIKSRLQVVFMASFVSFWL